MYTRSILLSMLAFLAGLAGMATAQGKAEEPNQDLLEEHAQQKQAEYVAAIARLVVAYRHLACQAVEPEQAETMRHNANVTMEVIATFSLEDYAKRRNLPPLSPTKLLPIVSKELEAYAKSKKRGHWAHSPGMPMGRICLVEMDRPAPEKAYARPDSMDMESCLQQALNQDYLGQHLEDPAKKLRCLPRACDYYLQVLALKARHAAALAQWKKSGRKTIHRFSYFKQYTEEWDIAGLEVWIGHWSHHYLIARSGSIRRATPAFSASVVAGLRTRWSGKTSITCFLEKALEAGEDRHEIVRVVSDIPGYDKRPAAKAVEDSIRPIKEEPLGNGVFEYTLYTYRQPGGYVVEWKLRFKEGQFLSIASSELASNIGKAFFLM